MKKTIYNAKALTYGPEVTFDDLGLELKDARVTGLTRPVNEGAETGWDFKNLVTKDIGSDRLYVAWISMDSGGGHDYHVHTGEEAIYVLKGEVQFAWRSKEGKDIKEILGQGDVCWSPAGTPHSFWNIGKDACNFLVIKSPPYFLEQVPLPPDIAGVKLRPI